ncbi:MAG: hypothetical protein ABII25_05300 [bacterium]
MFIEKLSPREKKYFLVVIIAGSFALADHFFFQKILDAFRNVDSETYLAEGKIRKNIYILSQNNRIGKEYKKFDVYFQKTMKSDEEEIAKISSLIEGKAKASRISINNMKPYPVKDLKTYKNYAIEIEAESRIGPLISFIYELESGPEMLKVEKFGLSVKEEGKPVFKTSMQISKIVIGKSEE